MKTRQAFDPIIHAAVLPVFGAVPAPGTPETHTASVFVTAAVGAEEPTARIGVAPTLRERLHRKYWHYEVDMSHHPVALRFSLPAKEEAFAFTATVTLLWAVRSPAEVALLGLRDLQPVLWTFLDQTLRGVSRQFSIEHVQAAEAEMRLVLQKEAEEIGFGLRLPMLAVGLRLDEETERYLSQRVHTGRAGNLADDRYGLDRQKAEYEERQAAWRSRLEQAQAEWRGRLEQAQAVHSREMDAAQAVHRQDLDAAEAEHARQIEQAQAVHRQDLDATQAEHARQIEQAQAAHHRELEKAQAEHQRTVEQLNAEHETKLKRQRLAFYRDALGGNHHEVMVLQLIENPHDIEAVLGLIEAGTAKHYDRSRTILKDLLDNHLANASDVDALTQHTIGELQTALSAAGPRPATVIEERVDERIRTEQEKHTERVIRPATT